MYAHSIRDYDLSVEGTMRMSYQNGALYMQKDFLKEA